MSQWRPTASVQALRQRAELLERVRAFFARRGVIEVQTPLLTESGVTDVHIESIATDSPAGWLRTSPEYFHKRLLAAGVGDLYELGPVFRRGEAGRHHQPEFTLLEWYRVGWTWRQLAEEVVELIHDVLATDAGHRPVRWLGWNDCFLETLDIDALSADTRELERLADDAPGGLDRDALLDWLFATRIQPGFEDGMITVVHDYPASQAALARISEKDPRVAERFEVFLGSHELANGYHELGDAAEQRMRFERDNRARAVNQRSKMPIDERLLDALESGLPDCSGVALGFDRLLMAALGAPSIAQAVSFAHDSVR
ncbi:MULTISPECIES: EF-P lysine aminoacylase EpmA [unclassified Wenzhouxiangella]|uniref:EF-P lysine aminoacylase EpmA n=1 Tax=unclassified Wenzhouxiangella TaxID=2613841 RepID=UPI000E325A52|nr:MULTISPECIES: EF-P lysine aminoacylase EpmA [unclassified Wenzhouxiangella]RFF27638.1 EF-P lysine aminoacylase GenX [Wenzhouxiangella sp. 15181]RFP70161.1 EF-P lysine aminoacylase GenX [Wenzhouxiangella sp. 15190]